MRYLLDLPVLVETLRPAPDVRVIGWLTRSAEAGFAAAALTLAELEARARAIPQSEARNRMVGWMRALRDSLEDRVMPFDAAAASAYATLRAQEARGTAPDATALDPMVLDATVLADADALVAATAQAHGLVLATRDAARFARWTGTAVDPWAG